MKRNNIPQRIGVMFGCLALFAILALPVAAQDDHMMSKMDHEKPTVAVIRADWCGYCQKLEPTMKELVEQYKDRINFVVFDVTTDEKVAESAETASKLGLSKFFEANKKNTSTVAVFGAKNVILFKTSKNFDREAYVRAFDDAIAKTSSSMKHG